MGRFDDLIPSGSFSDLVPKKPSLAQRQFGGRQEPLNIGNLALGPVALGGKQPGSAMPFLGQFAGNVAGGSFGPLGAGAGGVAGNVVGELGRQLTGKALGVREGISKEDLMSSAQGALATELTGLGVAGGLSALKKPASFMARKMMYNYLKPTGELAEKAGPAVERALEEGIVGGYGTGLQKAQGLSLKSQELADEAIRRKASDIVSREKIFGGLSEDVRESRQALNPERASIIEGESGAFRRAFQIPEDIAVVQQPKKGIFGESISPDRPVINETILTDRPITVGEAQAQKIAQYKELAKMKKEGGWASDVEGAKIGARREFARGLRRSIEDVVPEVKDINKRTGELIDIQKMIQRREPIDMRNQPIDMGDLIWGGASVVNPQMLLAVAARKGMLLPATESHAAQALYKFGKRSPFAESERRRFVNPALKAYFSNLVSGQEYQER
jgi:hypothetical protein